MLQNNKKIEHEGGIVKVDSNVVFVNIEQRSACSDCHAKGMCSIADKKDKIIEIPKNSDKHYDIGEEVVVTGAMSLGLKAVLYAFVLPLILIVLTLTIGLYFLKSETISALLSTLSLVVYYFVLYLCRNRLKDKFVFTLTKK